MGVAGTQEGSMKRTSTGRSSVACSMYSTPSAPMTLAISWGSVMTVVVPWGSTALTNSRGETMALSRWMWASIKPGRTNLPDISYSVSPLYSPMPTISPSATAISP